MIIGFTGTRHGMTAAQRDRLITCLIALWPDEFHHGDCVGADVEAAYVVFGEPLNPDTRRCTRVDCRIVCHPPVDESHRAHFLHNDETREPLTHLARNREIVKACDRLIATPFEMEHQPRGGTWYTVDYAVKIGKPVTIVWRNGTVEDWPR